MGKTTYKPRKATFVVNGVGKNRIFTPVNRRAKIVAKKVGKRTRVTVADIQRAKGLGTYKLCQYTSDGKLRAIRV